ncbi:MAG: small ribosomal subunit Rsm22 family protein [Deltaproteobacteria bacterium]|nr:small ribosomal subunit Rsm22 family protein [Deltaproteobacteria bacterium]
MQSFLKKLEAAIQWRLKEAYLPPHRHKHREWTHHDLQFFAKGADLLSTAFTEGRSILPKNYFNKKEFRSAYLLYFVLQNFVKVYKCLEQLVPGPQSLVHSPLKILDLGSGPGTAALACSVFFKDRPLEVFAFEQNEGSRKDALALWQKLAPSHHRLSFVRCPTPPKGTVDICIAANFLSEVPFNQQIDFCTSTLKHSNTFIIIEPALRITTRQLMKLRDILIEKKKGVVLAPCLHQKNCPMLAAGPRDWCHFYIHWKCPQIIRQVDQIVGNKHDYLKMAYMIFGATRSQEYTPGSLWRTVSSPLISKGKRELILCGDCGFLKKIDRLNKDKSPHNFVFDQIRRGDIVEWPDKSRVEKEDKIKIIRKF